jgi:hypothetical protein
VVVLAAFVLAACDDPRREATSRLRDTSAASLRADATRLHSQFFTSEMRDCFPLTPAQWPESAKKMKPVRVNLYRDGLAIGLRQEPGLETGLHILPLGITTPPVPTPYIEYEPIEVGIYRYSLKR